MPKKRLKKSKIFFCLKQISKCDTCFYNYFQGLLKNIVFRFLALVIKKLRANLDLILHSGLFNALYIKKIYKISFEFLIIKSKKISW